MKIRLCLICFILLYSCKPTTHQSGTAQKGDVSKTGNENEEVSYGASELELFLDSMGKSDEQPLMEATDFYADSVFKNPVKLDYLVNEKDWMKIKTAVLSKDVYEQVIDLKTAKKIFKVTPDTVDWEPGKVKLKLFSFDKNVSDFNEYAICPGLTESGLYGWSCNLYFFKQNKLIARHFIEHHYGLNLDYYTNEDGHTVVYYRYNFGTGSGIWQYNYFFYEYTQNSLLPLLNVLQNGNMQYGWGDRVFWLKSTIEKTQPLTFKMVYNMNLGIRASENLKILDDSCYAVFNKDKEHTLLKGFYIGNKLNEEKLRSYYLTGSEELFMHAYYAELKNLLQDKYKRQMVLNYLNKQKNKLRKAAQ